MLIFSFAKVVFWAQLFEYNDSRAQKLPPGMEVFHRTIGHAWYKRERPHNLARCEDEEKMCM